MVRGFATTLLLASVLSGMAAAQSAPSLKDIPAIAKAAKGAIVTIVTAVDDKPTALGTGFLVSPDGVIVTNYHVIATGNAAVVKFADGTILPVDGLLVADKSRDLAIIKIHGKTFPTLTLGNSDQIQVGEEVVAIGNPLGLELTVSNGILSGIRSDGKADDKFLQITAPISHGSSGGPLFNMLGEVVGINSMFLAGGESLNFAIPVNDAKKLLQNQSAQLQQLPNEIDIVTPSPDPSKPEASTGVPSDDWSSAEHKRVAAILAKKEPSYYIRAYQHGAYFIEYKGRQMVATCRETLVWKRRDISGLGGQQTDHECMYIVHEVGKHIPSWQMWKGDMELRYEPFGVDNLLKSSILDADILDIVAEAPMGSALRMPSPKTSPEILKSLHWIQNTLADREGTTLYGTDDIRENRLEDLDGCEVTFIHYTRNDEKVTDHTRVQVNLGALDPSSINLADGIENAAINGPVSDVIVHTTDKVPAVRQTLNDWSWQGSNTLTTTDLMWQLPAPYATRFEKALRHAITLCGGKPSSF